MNATATRLPGIRLTLRAFEDLREYSCSLPTGTSIGKCWKRRVPFTGPLEMWLVGQYCEHPEPGVVGIRWWRVMAVRPNGTRRPPMVDVDVPA